ncbi:MAG: coproporphyrinogen dehydrogenase HemZ [Ruminococcaceae bacterium]|nr:coproporphyrinogen dehydrogenase HemZ [Oscillospiraceae bacterium]
MYLVNLNHKYHYETENLLRLFFPEKIEQSDTLPEGEDGIITSKDGNSLTVSLSLGGEKSTLKKEYDEGDIPSYDTAESFFERKLALMMFELLTEKTGYTPPWGILTGVRPAKLMSKLTASMGQEQAKGYFQSELRVTKEKTELALCVAKKEAPIISGASGEKSFSLYVSIPFCPTRCSYCSFISHSNDKAKKLMPEYTDYLIKEIEETGKIAKALGLKLESVYYGGGTPTALTEELLERVTDAVSASFDLADIKEYTIEAGRPDSVTRDKFRIMKSCGCNRISINPQTFNDSVLREIGRNHTSQQTLEAMRTAREEGFDFINMDLIAGLPTDTLESYKSTLSTVLSLEPENITVHTLALKRSATLVTDKRQTNTGDLASQMLSHTYKTLTGTGYIPYYMYRQSKSLGNLENVGWAKEGYEGLYNVYMMEECHSILSVGAGAVTKLKNPRGNEIERIFNYKYPYEYINDFDEILKRKKRIAEFYSEIR